MTQPTPEEIQKAKALVDALPWRHLNSREEEIAYRNAAQEMYCNDDVEIDDNCTFSDALGECGGVWVQAWVWVPQKEEGVEA